MDVHTNGARQADELALDVLTLSRNTLLVHLRFLEAALCQLPFRADPAATLATDGQSLHYGFAHILQSFRIERELVTRSYLHCVLHCIFHHPFVYRLIDRDCWDLACDVAVEAVIEELDLPGTRCRRAAGQKELLATLRAQLSKLTAERVYHHLREQNLPPESLATLREPFWLDEHDLWYQLTQQPEDSSPDSKDDADDHAGSEDAAAHGDRREPEPGEKHPTPAPDGSGDGDAQEAPQPQPAERAEAEQRWMSISARVQTDLETASRQWGERAGNLHQSLREGNRERTDYRAFLRRFAVLGEVVQINDEEFDTIFYTYGLRLYGNMPLVEPLETRECPRIKEFVIAIDTSGSVQGELVERFIARTYEILKQSESFFERMNLYIIQCDSEIQQVQRITSGEEFDEYLRTLQLRGFGGTDFRPVFRLVDELVQNGELRDLKGLLYFTDGDGEYPARSPDYSTAFVFVDDEAHDVRVPVWAMKVILSRGELSEL